jgi:hypothetical protein
VPSLPTGTEGFAIVAFRSDSARVHSPARTHAWHVSPNPSNGLIHVRGPIAAAITVEVRDILGNTVLGPTSIGAPSGPSMSSESGSLTLDLRTLNLAAGVYFVRVESTHDDEPVTETIRVILR